MRRKTRGQLVRDHIKVARKYTYGGVLLKNGKTKWRWKQPNWKIWDMFY